MSTDLDKTPAQIEAGIRMDRANLYKRYDRALVRLFEHGSKLPLSDKITVALEVVVAAIDLRDLGIISDDKVQSAKDVLAGYEKELATLEAVHNP